MVEVQRWSPWINVNKDVNISEVGNSDVPFQVDPQVWGLIQSGPKARPPQGDPCGGLGYESKCWVRFNSWFDIFMNHIDANE